MTDHHRPSDNFRDTGRSHPEADDSVPEYDPHSLDVPRDEQGRDVSPYAFNPDGSHMDDPPPAEERAPTWQDVPPKYREHLARAVDAHNARRRQLGLGLADLAHFERAFEEGGPDALGVEIDRMADVHHDLGARIEAGEKRPLDPEQQALRDATGPRGGEFDPTLNDEYRLNAAAERGDVWAELERQGAIAPREAWGGPDGRDSGYYGDEQPPHSPRR